MDIAEYMTEDSYESSNFPRLQENYEILADGGQISEEEYGQGLSNRGVMGLMGGVLAATGSGTYAAQQANVAVGNLPDEAVGVGMAALGTGLVAWSAAKAYLESRE